MAHAWVTEDETEWITEWITPGLPRMSTEWITEWITPGLPRVSTEWITPGLPRITLGLPKMGSSQIRVHPFPHLCILHTYVTVHLTQPCACANFRKRMTRKYCFCVLKARKVFQISKWTGTGPNSSKRPKLISFTKEVNYPLRYCRANQKWQWQKILCLQLLSKRPNVYTSLELTQIDILRVY